LEAAASVAHNKGKYKLEKKEASDKGNKHTNNLYSAEIYNIFQCAIGVGFLLLPLPLPAGFRSQC